MIRVLFLTIFFILSWTVCFSQENTSPSAINTSTSAINTSPSAINTWANSKETSVNSKKTVYTLVIIGMTVFLCAIFIGLRIRKKLLDVEKHKKPIMELASRNAGILDDDKD